MQIEALSVSKVKIIRPLKHGDDRGFFSETYNRLAFVEAGIEIDFVQDNHAFSAVQGRSVACTSRRRLSRRTN